jgi:hypothetical protein
MPNPDPGTYVLSTGLAWALMFRRVNSRAFVLSHPGCPGRVGMQCLRFCDLFAVLPQPVASADCFLNRLSSHETMGRTRCFCRGRSVCAHPMAIRSCTGSP